MRKNRYSIKSIFEPNRRKFLTFAWLFTILLAGFLFSSLYDIRLLPEAMAKGIMNALIANQVMIFALVLPVSFAYLYVLSCLVVFFYERSKASE